MNYFGGRFYAPELGRFMSPDPAPVKAGEPFTFNRYIYGNNNPYKYKDPDGREVITIYNDDDLFGDIQNNAIHSWAIYSRDDGSEPQAFSIQPKGPHYIDGEITFDDMNSPNISPSRATQQITFKISSQDYNTLSGFKGVLSISSNYNIGASAGHDNCVTGLDKALRSINIDFLEGAKTPHEVGKRINSANDKFKSPISKTKNQSGAGQKLRAAGGTVKSRVSNRNK